MFLIDFYAVILKKILFCVNKLKKWLYLIILKVLNSFSPQNAKFEEILISFVISTTEYFFKGGVSCEVDFCTQVWFTLCHI